MTKAKPTTLGTFEGDEVAAATIRVTNAGDGLSTALQIEPRTYHRGDVVHVVLECVVSKVVHEEFQKDDDRVQRVHVLKAGTGTIVDAELVDDVLSAQKVANQKARDEAQGIEQLDLDGNPDVGE